MADDKGGLPTNQSNASIAADSKAMTEAMAKQSNAYRENSAALEKYGRLSKKAREEQQRLRDVMLEDAKAAAQWGKELLSLKSVYGDVSNAAKGFAGELVRMSRLSNVYADKLKYMREGQESFTKSLVATTGDTNRAMETSQKYVNAVHKSYANAHAIAGEFRIESDKVKAAVGELNKRFATQIAATGNMEGAMKGMMREAVVMGRYLGMDMTQVMDVWNDRMHASNMTLNEARKEFIAVAYQTDRYAKELAKLGDKILKTGNLGKKELVEMIQTVSREMRTGILDAAAYSRALTDLMVKSKKAGQTAQEQIGTADTMKNLIKSMSDMTGPAGVFGARAAQDIMAGIASGQVKMRDAALQQRLETVSRSSLAPVQKMQAIMEAGQGSAEFTALALDKLRAATEGNAPVLQEIAKTAAGGNQWLALQVQEQIASGDAQRNFSKQAEEDAAAAEGGRDKQTEKWKMSIEELVKASATPTDLDYKMIAVMEESKNYLKRIVTEFPLLMVGMQVGGGLVNLIGKRLLGRVATGAATKLLSSAAPTILGAGTKVAPIAGLMGNTVPGVAAPAAAKGLGLGSKALALGSRAMPFIGRALPALGTAGLWGAAGIAAFYGAKAIGSAMIKRLEESGEIIAGAHESYGDYLLSRWKVGEEHAKMYDRMDWSEKDKRFKLIDALDKDIKRREKHVDIMDEANKQELAKLKKEKEAHEAVLGERVKRRNVAMAESDVEGLEDRHKSMLERLQKIDISAADPEAFVNKLLFEKIDGKRLGKWELEGEAGQALPQMIADLMQVLPEEVRKKFGGNTQAIYAAARTAIMRHGLSESTGEQYDTTTGQWKTKSRGGVLTKGQVEEEWSALRGASLSKQVDIGEYRDIATKHLLGQKSDVTRIEMAWADPGGFGTNVTDAITPNARGDYVMPLGGLKFNISAQNNAAAKQKTKDSIGNG